MLLRLAVSIFLIQYCLANSSPRTEEIWPSAIAAFVGLFVLAGLWTPVSAGATALLELWIVMRTGDVRVAHFLAIAIAVSLTFLGPGAWSVDARLFGRRRISIPDR